MLASMVVPQLYGVFHKKDSPIPDKEKATIHAVPEEIGVMKENGAVTLALNTTEANVWPPGQADV